MKLLRDYKAFYERGYQVISGVLNEDEILYYKERLNQIYEKQIDECDICTLKDINEENMVRAPFLYDSSFIKLFYSKFANSIVRSILGDYAILSLQNAIIVSPHYKHHQNFFHRDIIHQDFFPSRPIAINLYYCLDDYDKNNGGTIFVPRSHKKEKKDVNFTDYKTPPAKAGSVILFDSMIYHKAGNNTADKFRFGINHMYTLPFVKQQINYPLCLKDETTDPLLNRILGFESREFLNVKDFRNFRRDRMKKDE